jgi:hypothetical protein
LSTPAMCCSSSAFSKCAILTSLVGSRFGQRARAGTGHRRWHESPMSLLSLSTLTSPSWPHPSSSFRQPQCIATLLGASYCYSKISCLAMPRLSLSDPPNMRASLRVRDSTRDPAPACSSNCLLSRFSR